MNQIMNDDDVVLNWWTQKSICTFLNYKYGLIINCVDYFLSVPVDERDGLCSCCASVVMTNIEHFERLIIAFYECKLITYAKKGDILDKLQHMKTAVNETVEVKPDEPYAT